MVLIERGQSSWTIMSLSLKKAHLIKKIFKGPIKQIFYHTIDTIFGDISVYLNPVTKTVEEVETLFSLGTLLLFGTNLDN